jgi:hypothetical protein
MRQPILVAGLLLLTSCILGATAFRDQLASAGTQRTHKASKRTDARPPTPVVFTDASGASTGNTITIGNTPTEKIDPTSNTVTVGNSPTVKIDPSNNTVNIDPASNGVSVTNTDASGNVRVHEQGTANVNVTNSSLPIGPPSPVTSGGGEIGLGVGTTPVFFGTSIATFLSIHMDAGVNVFRLISGGVGGKEVGAFVGPNVGGDANVNAPLSRPISFDTLWCEGIPGAECQVNWIGNSP